jgi:hypothetical protein
VYSRAASIVQKTSREVFVAFGEVMYIIICASIDSTVKVQYNVVVKVQYNVVVNATCTVLVDAKSSQTYLLNENVNTL